MSGLEDLYRRFPTLLMARRNLTRTTARTTLAVLGIVIGVVAIASLGVFGSVLQTAAVGNLGDIGNQVVVGPNAEEGVTSLSQRDVREIREASGDAGVVPIKRSRGAVEYGGASTTTSVYGISNPGAAFNASSGRIPDPLRGGALVGASLADDLDVRAGNSITVDNRTYRVRAVLAEQGGFSPLNVGGGVVVPAEQVNSTGFQQVVVQTETGTEANATARAIRASVNDREERVTITEFSQITEQIDSFFDTLSLFLIGIGSISLVVASVAILNVMLMSTIERRGEIGVLRAVGIRRGEVLRMILTEAAFLGVVGGAVGAACSLAVGLVMFSLITGNPMGVFGWGSSQYLLYGFLFAVVTSVLSGLYPAWKAANDRPVEALRG